MTSGKGRNMIKSELVQRIADRNPHLYLRDVEKIVNAILDESSMPGARRPGGIAWFGAFSVKHRDARLGRNPAHRRACFCR